MSFIYTPVFKRILDGDYDFADTALDLRVILVMSSTTAGTDEDAAVLSDIGTLDEFDGTGYTAHSAGGTALTSEATSLQTTGVPGVNDDDDRAEFDAANVTMSTIGAGTRNVQAAIVYRRVDDTTANDQPVAYIDTGGFPFAANGSDIVITWNAEGIIQLYNDID